MADEQQHLSGSEEEHDPADAGQSLKGRSQQGKKMAQSIAEFLLMRYFFPDVKNKKVQNKYKEDFVRDMQFHLNKGKVSRATDLLNRRSGIVTSIPSPCRKNTPKS